MNVEIGTEAPIFRFWEYLFQIFSSLSLQFACKECNNLNKPRKTPRSYSIALLKKGLYALYYTVE
jgi:hypothetical protein